MNTKTGTAVPSDDEAVVLFNVDLRPDSKALRDWEERLEATRQRLKDLPDHPSEDTAGRDQGSARRA